MKNIQAVVPTTPTVIVPEEFSRLYRMGFVDAKGRPELLGLESIASACSGCLYDDLSADGAMELYTAMLQKLIPAQPREAYAILCAVYATASEPTPKPVRLLAQNEDCLLYYIFAFLENWRVYLKDDGMLEE